MEHARPLEPIADESPLAHARLSRQLTVDETARRADVAAEEVQWLEEGRLYRFPTPDRAILVALLTATALGIEHREALELAGLPVPPRPLEVNPWHRLAAVGAVCALLAAGVLAVVLARSASGHGRAAVPPAAAAVLPPPWGIPGRCRSACRHVRARRRARRRRGAPRGRRPRPAAATG